MAAIFDLFSSSFLFSVAIIIICIGGLFAYVSYRLSEQDNKFASLVGAITALAEEIHHVRTMNTINNDKTNDSNDNTNNDDIKYPSELMGGSLDLISVSDGSVNESSDDDNDMEDEDLDEEFEDEDEVLDEDLDEDFQEPEDEDNTSHSESHCLHIEDINMDNFDNNDLHLNDSVEQTNNNDVKILTINMSDDVNCVEEENNDTLYSDVVKSIHIESTTDDKLLSNEDLDFLKTIGDNDELNSLKLDYKKMSLNKLREVVLQKGIVSDASKLKKNDILKLLGDD
jgi:hypothetical protein